MWGYKTYYKTEYDEVNNGTVTLEGKNWHRKRENVLTTEQVLEKYIWLALIMTIWWNDMRIKFLDIWKENDIVKFYLMGYDAM
jgi:hypothetical protein